MIRYLTLVLVLCVLSGICAQSVNTDNQLKYIDILPPSPAVASISNVTKAGVGMVSGTAQFNVPITSLSVAGFSIPIGVNYSSNGVKVDEIASRVGMGFQFEGGGVITRTVRGTGPDELTTHKLPPNWSTSSRDMIDYLKTLTASKGVSGSYDSELDLFNFSMPGNSGQFILDDEGGATNTNTVKQINKSNLKFERDFSSSAEYTFRITDGQGNQFYFGGNGYMETSKKSSTCGKSYESQYHPTAWFLKKIRLFNQEEVLFTYLPVSYTYDLGVNQTNFYQPIDQLSSTPCSCPQMVTAVNTCVNFIAVNTLIPHQISARETTATFTYQLRSDCGDKLLSQIDVSTSGESYIQQYQLEYNQIFTEEFLPNVPLAITVTNDLRYRPFLKNIKRRSQGQIMTLYKFDYDDAQALPVRLSFAQDHWGYFNGKSNGTLLTLSDESLKYQFLTANANREPDEDFSGKGMLKQIHYPTGGFDVIVYEPNSHWETKPVYPTTNTTTTYSMTKISNVPHHVDESAGTPLTIGFAQSVSIYLTSAKTSSSEITEYDFGNVRFVRTSSGGGEYLNTSVQTSEGNVTKTGLLPAGNYLVYVKTGGQNTVTQAILTYKPGVASEVTKNWPRAGMRVKSIQSYLAEGEISQTRRYKYGSHENPDQSVAVQTIAPAYYRAVSYDYECMVPVSVNSYACQTRSCSYSSLFSSAINNLFMAQGGVVSYPTVLELIEDSQGQKNTGMIEHEFYVINDGYGTMINGARPNGAPQTNWSAALGGKEYRTTYYSRNESIVNGITSVTYRKVKRIHNQFTPVSSSLGIFDAVLVNKLFTPCYDMTGPVASSEINPYEIYRYSTLSPWTVLESTTEEVYDQNLETLAATSHTTYVYSDPISLLPTQITTTNSQGKTEVVDNFYTTMSSSQPQHQQTALNLLSSKNNFSLIAKTGKIDGTYTSGYRVEYDSNDFILLPRIVKEFGRGGQQINQFSITERDDVGNILERENQAGVKESYVWDQWQHSPIAKVVGADRDNIAYSNFESSINNWSLLSNASRQSDPSAPFGTNVLVLDAGTISKTGIDPSKRYIVSYWAKAGSVVSPESVITTLAAEPGENGWSYFRFVVGGANDVTIAGTGSIDDLRCHPIEAQMSTFVYDAGGKRMRLASDANGRISKYSYDEFDRLIAIRDGKNKVIKSFQYYLKGQ